MGCAGCLVVQTCSPTLFLHTDLGLKENRSTIFGVTMVRCETYIDFGDFRCPSLHQLTPNYLLFREKLHPVHLAKHHHQNLHVSSFQHTLVSPNICYEQLVFQIIRQWALPPTVDMSRLREMFANEQNICLPTSWVWGKVEVLQGIFNDVFWHKARILTLQIRPQIFVDWSLGFDAKSKNTKTNTWDLNPYTLGRGKTSTKHQSLGSMFVFGGA